MQIRIIALLLVVFGIANAGVFNDRYPSARAAGMGNSYVAIANDVWAPYYNPAGLAQLNNYSGGIAYQVPYSMSFFSNYFISGAAPLPEEYGTAAFSAEGFTVESGDEVISSEYALNLSHGFYLFNDIHSSLSVGYNLKYYHWDLGRTVGGVELGAAGVFAMDIGLQATIYKRTYLGVYYYNMNAPKIGVATPRDLDQRIVVGAAYRPYTGLTTSLSINKTVGYEAQVEAGFEFYIMEYLALRLGAGTEPNRFSAGFGINYAGFTLDYAFRSHPVMAETHQFGLIYSFGD